MAPWRPLRKARVAALAAWVGAALLAFGPGAARSAPRLDYRGTVPPSREVESLARRALAAPRDSAALSDLLGELVRRLEQRGFLDARATADWDTTRGPDLRVEVREGRRYPLAAVAVNASSRADSLRLAQAAGLAPGGWASPRAVSEAIDRGLLELVNHGYPYAALGVSDWQTDSAGVHLVLGGGLGPLVTVSAVRFEGLRVTQPRFLERSLGRLSGLPYSRAAAESGRERLSQLGLFRSVTLEGLEGESDWSRGRLVYRVEEPRYNRFEGAVGVQGEAGTVGLARLSLANLLGTGRALDLNWESPAHGVARLGARYAEPLLLGTPLRLEGAFAQDVQDTFYVSTRWGARARLSLSAQERIEAGYEQERVVQEHGELERARTQSTVFALERATLDDPLGPRHGTRARISAEQSFKTEHLRPPGTRTARSSAAELEAEWHRPTSARSGVALELHSAGRFSSQRVLPFFERYPLGGATTLRGFDEEAFRVDRYALTRLEWRWFLGPSGQRAFLFWDHAKAASRLARPGGGDRLETFDRDGLGFGLRLEAAGSLVGLEYGLEPGRPPLEGKLHLRLVSAF